MNYRGGLRRGRNRIQPAILPTSGDYWTDNLEGVGTLPGMSWTSDKSMEGVSELVDQFRTTFVFGINSLGQFNGIGQTIGQCYRRGTVRC